MFGKRKLKEELDYKQGRIDYLEEALTLSQGRRNSNVVELQLKIKALNEENEAIKKDNCGLKGLIEDNQIFSNLYINGLKDKLDTIVAENISLREKDAMWQEAEGLNHKQFNQVLGERDKLTKENQELKDDILELKEIVRDRRRQIGEYEDEIALYKRMNNEHKGTAYVCIREEQEREMYQEVIRALEEEFGELHGQNGMLLRRLGEKNKLISDLYKENDRLKQPITVIGNDLQVISDELHRVIIIDKQV